jgi:hypothetical protein
VVFYDALVVTLGNRLPFGIVFRVVREHLPEVREVVRECNTVVT